MTILTSRRIRCTGHKACTGKTRNPYQILVRKLWSKKQRNRKNDNIKIELWKLDYFWSVFILVKMGSKSGFSETFW